MAKIMLVEDDKSLREIYSIRLVAEGYEVVSAGDGEEALALAVKSRPDLVISDVMMPKISGFDMLDILRSTPETKDIKVIMMTALSSDDQRQRGESLGADKYLVKSQVGIEDVINAVHEVLNDRPTDGDTASEASSSSADARFTQRTESASRSSAPASSNPSSDSAPQGIPVQEASIPAVPQAAPVAPTNPEPAAAPAPATDSAPAQQTAPAAPAPQQNTTAEAMEQLLNSAPEATNATWPGSPAK